MFVDQRFDDWVEVALHDLVELVEGEVDAVVGDASLRKIVGADASGAVARAHQRLACGGLFGLLFFTLGIGNARGEQGHGAGTVLML